MDNEGEIAALREQLSGLAREVAELKKLLGLDPETALDAAIAAAHLRCDSLTIGRGERSDRAQIISDQNGARVVLRDSEGVERMALSVSNQGPRLAMRSADEELCAGIWEDYGEGTVAVFAPGGKPRAALKGLAAGGVVNVVNDTGEAEVAMVGRPHGGEVFVLNKSRSASVRLAAFEDSAVLSAQRGDQPVTTMAATTRGGSFVVLGKQGEVAAVMAGGEEGGHVRVFDDKGVSRAGMLVRKEVASITVENAQGNEVCALSCYKEHGRLDLRNEAGQLGMSLDSGARSSLVIYDEERQTAALISSNDNGGVVGVNDHSGQIAAVMDVEGSQDKPCGRIGVAAPGQAIRALMTTNGAEGVVAVLNEEGAARATMIGLPEGGTFHSYGDENTVLAVMGGTNQGGALTINNDLGICRAAMCVHKDGGQVQLYWAGSPVATLSAQEASGMLYLFDKDGELHTRLPEDAEEEGEE